MVMILQRHLWCITHTREAVGTLLWCQLSKQHWPAWISTYMSSFYVGYHYSFCMHCPCCRWSAKLKLDISLKKKKEITAVNIFVSREKQRTATLEHMYIWVRSRNCGCLVTWFCYQLIAKPGNKTATVSWLYPYSHFLLSTRANNKVSCYFRCYDTHLCHW